MNKKSTETAKISKKQLKTMLKSGKNHPIRNATRVAKYGASGFTRNLWLSIASVFVMSITLIVIFATIIANLVLVSITDSMRDKIDVTVYLRPETTGEELLSFSKTLYKNPNVRLVEVSDSKRELEKFAEDRKDSPEITAAIKDAEMHELLLKSMNATLTIKLKNVDEIESIKQTLENTPEIKAKLDTKKPPTYETKRTIIERIRNWANTAKFGGIALSIVFLAISILMIINTVKVAVFSRREEIYMMKLVGANRSFIKGPFLIEAEISGIISGVIATIAGVAAFNFILPHLYNAEINRDIFNKQSLNPTYIIITAMSMIVTGAVIGAVSARLAIQKYVK